MSLDIYAVPNLSKKVRNNRKVEEEAAEWQEMEVDIYQSSDNIRDQTDFQSQEGGPHSQDPEPDHIKTFRGAAVCLGVLCLLMVAGIIFLSIHFTLEKEQQQSRLIIPGTSSNQSESNNKELQNKTAGKFCPEGWTRFGCSCYFKSTENKTWSESRRVCEDRGSDLVIITSKEEQDFVIGLNMNEEFWIGLRAVQDKHTSTGYKWEWVDDSRLSNTFWSDSLSPSPTGFFNVSCCEQEGKWRQNVIPNKHTRNWMCEKKISDCA